MHTPVWVPQGRRGRDRCSGPPQMSLSPNQYSGPNCSVKSKSRAPAPTRWMLFPPAQRQGQNPKSSFTNFSQPSSVYLRAPAHRSLLLWRANRLKNAPVYISHVVDVVKGLEHPLQDVSNGQFIHAIHEVSTDEILCRTWRTELWGGGEE